MTTPNSAARAAEQDDIIQRLRDNADLDEAEHGNARVVQLEREAADEIERLRRERSALRALVAGEAKHPDDAAVDRFAAAMKAKLAKKRAEGHYGWQNTSHITLSSLLYEHMYKGDPLDVGNLAMMLHQNGKPIELPEFVRGTHAAPQASAEDVRNAALEAAVGVVAGEWEKSVSLSTIVKAIRALKQPQAAKDGGQQRAEEPFPANPLRVFAAGIWTYDGAGQALSHTELDEAAFVTYRAALSATQSEQGERDADKA